VVTSARQASRTARQRARIELVAAVVLAVALIAAAPVAGAGGSTQGRPIAVVDHGPGTAEVYWKGTDGYLWENAETGGPWRGAMRTPIGPLGSYPAATVGPAGSDYVFWQGSDAALWQAAWTTSGGWSTPTRVGMGPLGSQPAATSWGDSSGAITIDVFWQGTDGNLWQASYAFATGIWSGPHQLGMGPLGSAPTAVAQGSATGTDIQVFWKGADNALWEGQTAGGAWTGPKSLGMGPLGSAPSVGWLPSGEEDVFWAGTNGKLWQAQWSGSAWKGPISTRIGPLDSAPTVGAAWPTEQDVFWFGFDGNLWEATDVAGTWTSVQSRGPLIVYPPAQTTPVPVTVTPPTPTRSRRQIRVKIFMKWTWNGSRTRLRALRFGRFPGPGTIGVSCHGRGCPRHASKAGHHGLRALIRALERRRFSSGQRLTITVSAPGYEPERAQVVIRNGALPIARLL
jgi:hypothetical protein